VVVDLAGNVYVADSGNHTIRKITRDGAVTTLAGLAGSRGSLDGQGTGARFFAPFGIAVDSAGIVYVSEVGNCTIRKIAPDGVVSTLAGLAGNPGGSDGVGDNAQFRNPFGVAVDADGNVYVADTSNFTIRKVTPKGVVSTLAGLAGDHGSTDGLGTNARFWEPRSVAVLSPGGDVYVADTGNHMIRKISPAGLVSFGDYGAQTLAADNGGHVYAAGNDHVWVLPLGGVGTDSAVEGELGHPDALAADGHGDIYVADSMNNVIRKLTPAQPFPSP